MHRILIPIDFSLASANALKFACQLAKDKGMKVSLIYCYPYGEENRKYTFDGMDYSKGIHRKLIGFYEKHIGKPTKETRFIARSGPIGQKVVLVSGSYELIILSGNSFTSKISRWIGSKSLTIATEAKCPVLIVSSNSKYKSWDHIWHIKRQTNEPQILSHCLEKIHVDLSNVETKMLNQVSFTSEVWESITTFVKTPKKELEQKIIAADPAKSIDLILLVSHQKDRFQTFINKEAIQIIFKFNIPVLICQEGSDSNLT